MKIYDKFGNLVKEITPTIKGESADAIIHIDGYCEYYVESLRNWMSRNSPVLCIDAGEGLYVWTEELKKFL